MIDTTLTMTQMTCWMFHSLRTIENIMLFLHWTIMHIEDLIWQTFVCMITAQSYIKRNEEEESALLLNILSINLIINLYDKTLMLFQTYWDAFYLSARALKTSADAKITIA